MQWIHPLDFVFQHVGESEFRDMYSAMEKHHRRFNLAHLTGISKDVL